MARRVRGAADRRSKVQFYAAIIIFARRSDLPIAQKDSQLHVVDALGNAVGAPSEELKKRQFLGETRGPAGALKRLAGMGPPEAVERDDAIPRISEKRDFGDRSRQAVDRGAIEMSRKEPVARELLVRLER